MLNKFSNNKLKDKLDENKSTNQNTIVCQLVFYLTIMLMTEIT